jgi:hypothetical protein
MTIRKQYPTRSYDTFDEQSQESGDANKSRSAAAEARRLASGSSWADSFGSPATDRTPAAFTVDGDETRDARYAAASIEDDPSDPPPVYTPSVSTQPASQSPAPASPVAARSVPAQVPEPVSAPTTDSSSQPPTSQAPAPGEQYSDLPEAVAARENEDEDSEDLPLFMQSYEQRKNRWRRMFRKKRGCGGHRHRFGRHKHGRDSARRFKKICFFMVALLICLLLLIPGLCQSFQNVDAPFLLYAAWVHEYTRVC